MGKPWGNYKKWDKTMSEGQIMHNSTYELSEEVKFIEIESRMVFVSG